MSNAPTYYDTLGVAPDAPAEDIKRAFRRLLREHHPDLAGPAGEAMSARVSEAYDVLSTPDRREAYDRSLSGEDQAPPPDPWADEDYNDAWGQEEDWGDPVPEPQPQTWTEEVLDDEITDEHPASTVEAPPSTPQPAPTSQKGRWPLAAYPQARYRTPTMLLPIWGGLAAVWTILGLIATWTATLPAEIATNQAKGIALAIAAGLGLILGGMAAPRAFKSKPWTLRGAITEGVAVFVLTVAVGIAASVLLGPKQAVLTGAAQVGLALFTGMLLLGHTLGVQKRLNRSIPAGALRKNNIYGSLPGGVAADLLNTDLAQFFDIPTLRMFRPGDEGAPFSHGLIVGDRLALVRAVQGNGGTYRWSGPSLLCQESVSGFPEERLRGPYDAALRNAEKTFPGKVSAWLVVYTLDGAVYSIPDPQRPAVRAPQDALLEIGDFILSGNVAMVDQQKVVSAIHTLLQ